MKIKICGITNMEDALAAIEAGADMLGFNFYPKSPRCVTPEQCAAIVSSLHRHRTTVISIGVFVNSPCEHITAILDQCGLHLAQLSGDEPASDLEALGQRAFKALHIRDPQSALARLATLPPRANPPACLLDAHVPGQYGGTGQTADWRLAASLARQAPILLAGGLTLENVAEAVRQVHPWGVDVASGVETKPGSKDAEKMRLFVRNARRAAIQIEPACLGDAAEILQLQKLAYQSEAEIYEDYSIPPLRQTRPEIEMEFRTKIFLKATTGDLIVGSVRAHLQDNTCHIERLIVHPDWQNQGLGSRLMEAVEQRFGSAQRCELFTGAQSVRNIHLYQKLGYRIFRREHLTETVELVYLEKRRES